MPAEAANNERHVIGLFTAVDPFMTVLQELLDNGFHHGDVSILAPHADVEDHFDRKIPDVRELADRPDTPREDLETEGSLDSIIRWIAEGASVVSAAFAQGAAYAVGGPVGVATATGAAVESSVERVLSDYVGDQYTRQFEETLKDGGLLCWVRVTDDAQAEKARAILARHGGTLIHEVAGP